MTEHLEDPGEAPARERGGDHPAGQDATVTEPAAPRHKDPAPAYRFRLVVLMILGAILALLALVVLALYGVGRNEQAKAADQTLGDLASQVQAACKANPTDARKVFGDVCGTAKTITERPAGEKGDPGAAGQPGATGPPGPAPSAAQVAAAVSSYCAGGKCTGKSPSASQVAAAVAAYCNAKGECRGPSVTGSPGAQGSPGVAGQQGQQGAPGEPATGEQVAAGVASYCGQASDPCKGKDGAPGAPGQQGPQGIPGPDSSAEKCAAMTGELQQITVQTDDPLQPAKVLVCVLK